MINNLYMKDEMYGDVWSCSYCEAYFIFGIGNNYPDTEKEIEPKYCPVCGKK